MTKEEALKQLRELAGLIDGGAARWHGDPETAHLQADGVLTDFLRAIGHGDIADAFDAIEPKWYA